MATPPLPPLDPALVRGLVDIPDSTGDSSRPSPEVDAYAGIDELRALQNNLDHWLPPEAAEMVEPLVEKFRGEVNASDRLRLPPASTTSARALHGALTRVLSAHHSAPFPDRDAVAKEHKMLQLVRAFASAASQIQKRSAMSVS